MYQQIFTVMQNAAQLPFINGNFKIFLTHVSGQKCSDEKCTVYVIYVPKYFLKMLNEKCTKIIHNCLNLIKLIPTSIHKLEKYLNATMINYIPESIYLYFSRRGQ